MMGFYLNGIDGRSLIIHKRKNPHRAGSVNIRLSIETVRSQRDVDEISILMRMCFPVTPDYPIFVD
jgi:hypothetical protein